jgi:DNA-directed RNA polymerase specialized sigma24 family protein
VNQLTALIGRIQAGDTAARDALFAAAYGELRRLARARLRDGGRNTMLDTTALVHESYLRFVRAGELRAEDRRAFFAYASQVMRSVTFRQVLEAVQYAHEKRVIHRDLKPSNILVTESGQVRLLDFGVSRLLEADESDRTPLTSVYGRAFTPDYASPELLRGDPIDARSDIVPCLTTKLVP